MIAYHNNPTIKQMYLDRVQAHREAEQLVQHFGYYNKDEDGQLKMCAVGCTIHGSSHAAYEAELGIPRILARLEDEIFESLPYDAAMRWPHEFLAAVPVGADLSLVWARFAHWLLVDPVEGVIRFAKTDSSQVVISSVAALHLRWINEVRPLDAEWIAAANAADAANAAADAAANAANATYAANAAAAAAANAAAAAGDAAAAAARQKARLKQSEQLLELLAAAPVSTVPVL